MDFDREQVLNIVNSVYVFQFRPSTKMAALASSVTFQRILMKLNRKQVLNVLY